MVFVVTAITMLQSLERRCAELITHTAIVNSNLSYRLAAKLIGNSKDSEPHFVFHREQLLFITKKGLFGTTESCALIQSVCASLVHHRGFLPQLSGDVSMSGSCGISLRPGYSDATRRVVDSAYTP